jgi:hypothetical protein
VSIAFCALAVREEALRRDVFCPRHADAEQPSFLFNFVCRTEFERTGLTIQPIMGWSWAGRVSHALTLINAHLARKSENSSFANGLRTKGLLR